MSIGMTCPNCNGQLVRGKIGVRGTKAGLVVFGLSWQHLWWSNGNEWPKNRRRLITSGDSCTAHACPSCGTVVFRPFPLDGAT